MKSMKRVYYLGFYDIEQNKSENRNYVLSATNKMQYIIDTIETCGHSVEVISASQTLNSVGYPGKVLEIGKRSRLHLFRTLKWGNKVRRVLSRHDMLHQVYRYLLRTLKKEDTVIAYHSVAYMNLLLKAKKKIGFRLILEVEEIYADVAGNAKGRVQEEQFFKYADAYIFPTQLLDKTINTLKKPSVIIHGTYQVESKRGQNIFFKTDKMPNTVHCVYAGTFDPKKGSLDAILATEYLPSNYHVHILGFGTEKDKQAVKDCIAQTSEKSIATVTFDGLLSGEEYIRFIQSCEIGLSTQNPDAEFNATSFPSKILSYMANGLRVVSIRIPAIEQSAVGDYLQYYEKQTPEEIAKAILSVDFSDGYDGRKIISNLDSSFCQSFAELLGE